MFVSTARRREGEKGKSLYRHVGWINPLPVPFGRKDEFNNKKIVKGPSKNHLFHLKTAYILMRLNCVNRSERYLPMVRRLFREWRPLIWDDSRLNASQSPVQSCEFIIVRMFETASFDVPYYNPNLNRGSCLLRDN